MYFSNITIIKALIIAVIATTSLSCNSRESENKNSEDMKTEWVKLSEKGLQGDLGKGVSAAFAATINGKIIVAGGANFPDKLGFEGGAKAFYDEILMYDEVAEEWQIVGKLPVETAYGASVALSDGALWIGGNNADSAFKTCYHVSLNSDNEVVLKDFPSLPVTMDNFYGCSINDLVFAAGGNVSGKPSNSIYYINAKTDSEWLKLTDFPGIPRVQPVIAPIEKDGDILIYLLGGFYGGDANQVPAMATEVLKYNLTSNEWSVVGYQTDKDSDLPFSLGGATSMPVDNRYILCLGGVNHDIFVDAITTQYNIANNSELSAEDKAGQNLEFSKVYMTQPVEYYKFNTECRIFDTHTGEWSVIDDTADAARAGATLVFDGNDFYVVQGELKPGLRSSTTFKGKIAL